MQGDDEQSAARRERLRRTFAVAAGSYQSARPEYPPALFDDLIASTEIRAGASILEIGCATGKATLPLAGRGFRITCVEISEQLVAEARHHLGRFPEIVVEISSFEDWEPSGRDYELVMAATSWHWLDPETRYRKAWRVLRPDAHLAIWGASHVFPEDGDPIFRDLQDVYEEIGEGSPADALRPAPGELEDMSAEIARTGLFYPILVRHYDWERVYDADGYIALLDTFSGHIAMQQWQRDRLYGEIRRRLSDRDDGLLRRHWGSVLHVARRLEPS